jgi:AraC-like DNA-binding protein
LTFEKVRSASLFIFSPDYFTNFFGYLICAICDFFFYFCTINIETNHPYIMKKIIILLIFTVSQTMQILAQEKTNAEKADSIVTLLPQLSGEAKLQALATLTNITAGLPSHRQFLRMYLDEARRQKNIENEANALHTLTLAYYSGFDNDSIFIFGEEAIRLTRQLKRYDQLFQVHNNLIRRYKAEGKLLTALRKAEEAYAEAKELQLNMPMANILSALAEISNTLEQYEEAVRYSLESIELAKPYRQENRFFIFFEYMSLVAACRELKRPQEALAYADSMRMELDRWKAEGLEYNMQSYYFYAECDRVEVLTEMNRPAEALAAIQRTEALFEPQWAESNPAFNAQIDLMYAAYYRLTGDYDKALELFERIMRFDEQAGLDSHILAWKEVIADVNFEKGDFNTAARMYHDLKEAKKKENKERFYAQINELRTLYGLDKAELEAATHLAEIRRQRLVNTGLVIGCMAMMLIVALILWNRKKIAEKNRGLYLKIKEQDRLADELEAMTKQYEQLRQSIPHVETHHATSLPGNVQQRQLVSRLRELLLKDRYYSTADIDIQNIIPLLATNRTYLFEALKAVTGMSPTDFVTVIRLEEAKRLLENSTLTIETIASDCGFNIASTFYRQFKEQYRITPAEYRKIAKSH